ncbi:MAG: DoxX family protein, partial [Bacteroidota bacterium]
MLGLILRIRRISWFQYFTLFVRFLIGGGFIFASLVKVKGERFTTLPTSTSVGYFFEAMYQTGFYWKFLGLSQLIAGILLLTQRFATFGAMIFFAVILNIMIITW